MENGKILHSGSTMQDSVEAEKMRKTAFETTPNNAQQTAE
jgi:hypothetical protein